VCGILVRAGLGGGFSHRDLQSLRKRGPDALGFWTNGKVNFGHTRLSIIGLSERATEPFENERYVLAYNGEIYNFLELRRRLSDRLDLSGANDGETLLEAWTAWGPAVLSELVGFWAFVIYDKLEHTLLLVRDQLGVKPLYYWVTGSRICVASMIRTILENLDHAPELDYEALSEYAAYQFTFGDKTFISGLRKVSPGHLVRIAVDTGEVSSALYDDVLAPTEECVPLTREWVEHTRTLLMDCIAESTISDASFTTLCSGGIDSSLITRIAAPEIAYHCNYSDPDCNETFFARQVVEGTDTRLYVVNANEWFNLVERLASIVEDFDELTIGSVILPLDDLLGQVKRRYKVLLTGTGGDELFGGYVRYQLALGSCFQDSYKVLFARMRNVSTVAERFELSHRKGHTDYFRFYNSDVETTFRKAYEDCRTTGDELHAMLTFDRRYFLPGLLNIDDKMAARHSLESRPSLLHQRFVRHVNGLEPSELIKTAELKSVLRQVAEPLLPEGVVRRSDKMGFTTPIGLFVQESSHLVREQLMGSQFADLYNLRQVNFGSHDKFSREAFGLLMLDLWLNQYAA